MVAANRPERMTVAASKTKKRMSTTARVSLITLGGLIVLLVAGYAAAYAMAGDSLPKDSVVAGVTVGGLTPRAAEAKLREALAPKEAAALTVTAGKASAKVDPRHAGLAVDYDASIAQAGGGRSLNPVIIFETLFGGHNVPAVVTVDATALDKEVSKIAAAVEVETVDAKLAYSGTTPKVTPGVEGTALKRPEAAAAIKAAYLTATSVKLPVEVAEPDVTTDEAKQALSTLAAPAVAAPVSVAVGDAGTISIKPQVIASVLSFAPGDGGLVARIDSKKLSTLVAADLDKVGLKAPKDARFTIGQKKGDKPKIVPSQDGLGVDAAALGNAVLPVLQSKTDRQAKVGTVPRPASFTTKDAEAAGVKTITGKFTTYFPGTAYRYNNIGKAAKLINGTFLKPGETFSMNKTLGERTPQAGWMKGGGIANGKIDPAIYGGGISQSTTTTFNAIFFAGLKDIYHKPHSLYFSRYPMGREATLDFKSVDMKFQNDSKYGVLLQAWITGSTGSQGSVTVRVWSTKTWDIKATKPVQSNWRAPGKTIYDDSKGCVPQSAMSGFDVKLYREFYQKGKLVKREPFRWSYNSLTPVVCGKKPSK